MKSYAPINQLSTLGMSQQEALQRIKAEIWAEDFVPESLAGLSKSSIKSELSLLPVIVAEGDSWFDYPVGIDVLDQLRRLWGYKIYKFSQAGDTLANMVYGTKIQRDFQREASGLYFVKEGVTRYSPKIVLLSAGGNDIAGDDLASYLNHIFSPESKSGKKWLREDVWASALATMSSAIEVFSKEIWKMNSSVHILMHGYANPVPDGRAVLNFPLNFRFIGPWIRPAFSEYGYTDWKKTQPWVEKLIGDYNDLISSTAQKLGTRFHYVDTRSVVDTQDWANELHPTNRGFEAVARKIQMEISKIA